ncbi:MAG: hypothetical protein Ta2B_03570 [Termitinemataceae bacterium]|nr:MAG: hypothetical protein Ta2B_03570 [Termitinemataceae bacterium]
MGFSASAHKDFINKLERIRKTPKTRLEKTWNDEYDGPIPIEKVRSTHLRVMKLAEKLASNDKPASAKAQEYKREVIPFSNLSAMLDMEIEEFDSQLGFTKNNIPSTEKEIADDMSTFNKDLEQKIATVCCVMIRDFAEISEGLDAASLVDFINNYLEVMLPCITSNCGSVDKLFTQDGLKIMALWGSSKTGGSAKEDALNCINAAFAMRAALGSLNEKRTKTFGVHIPLIKMCIGINTGAVVTAKIGSEQRMEYAIIGDAVNFSVRIAGQNNFFDTDILISEETYNLVSPNITAEEQTGIAIKGKEKAFRIFSAIKMP